MTRLTRLKQLVIPVSVVFTALVSGKTNIALQSTKDTTQQWERINTRENQRIRGDEMMLRQQVDDIFSSVGYLVHSHVAPALKDRIVRAQLGFELNGKGPVTEQAIVAAINTAAEKLNAPNHVQTDPAEVRRLRTRLLLSCPSMIIAGDGGDESIRESMSPLQASYVAAMLVRQKLFNPEFQMTPEERQRAFSAGRFELDTADVDKLQNRSEETRAKLSTLSNMDQERFVEEFLTSLGIEQ